MLANMKDYEPSLPAEQTVQFANGIPGFRERKRYSIIEVEDTPFSRLQSLDEEELAFLIVSPFVFFHDYEFTIDEAVQAELSIEDVKDLDIWVIVSVKDEFMDATANLMAPVVVNRKNGAGKQVILQGTVYETRHSLFPE